MPWLVCRLRVLPKQVGVLQAYGTHISRSQGQLQVERLQTSQSISTTGNAKLSGTSIMSKGALHAAQYTPASHVALQQAAQLLLDMWALGECQCSLPSKDHGTNCFQLTLNTSSSQ
jgi:hypothetical protein